MVLLKRTLGMTLLLLLAQIISACEQNQSDLAKQPRCHEEGLFATNDILMVCGNLTSSIFLEEVLEKNIKTQKVVVNSGGGAPMVAIKIGKAIRENGWHLEIEGGCASACAQYILPASIHPIIVRKDAIIGFHHTATAVNDLIEYTSGRPSLFFSDLSNAELSYYEDLELSTDLLRVPFLLLSKSRISLDAKKDGPLSLGIDYKNDQFVSFCHSELERLFHIEITGSTGCGQTGGLVGENYYLLTEYPTAVPNDPLNKIEEICLSNHTNPSGDLVRILRESKKCWKKNDISNLELIEEVRLQLISGH